MKKQLVFAMMALVCGGTALACEPGTAEFQDTFFKYCDDARARAQESPAVVPAATQATGSPGEKLPPRHEENQPGRAPAPEPVLPELVI
ncbi:MAG: hypothetical protein ACK4R8_10040 [Thiobacillus sp.]